MDSFTIFFGGERSDDEISTAILATGVEVSRRAAHEIAASRKTGQVWIDYYPVAKLPLSEFDNCQTWPMQKDQVGSVVKISVRRDEDSTSLAIDIAHQLATQLGGAIAWDGNEPWKASYEVAYQRDTKPSG